MILNGASGTIGPCEGRIVTLFASRQHLNTHVRSDVLQKGAVGVDRRQSSQSAEQQMVQNIKSDAHNIY
jgi:hypothetical protein